MLIDGYFPMHDDTQPARVFALSQELKRGIFPVRLVSLLGYGYGYPIFNFYAPLPYYLGALLYLSGLDLIIAAKMMFIIGSLLAGIFMYILVQSQAGPAVAIASSLFYLYAPYHAVNMYVRGAVGEYYAYAFLPLLFFGIAGIFKKGFKFLFAGALGLAAIILSHNILGLITVYFLFLTLVILLILFFYKKISVRVLISFIIIILLGISLSSFFILPAVFEKDYTLVNSLTAGGSNYRNHFVSIVQLWDSPWGFGGSVSGLMDGLSFKIGKFHILASLLALFLLQKRQFYFSLTVFVIFLLSVFMMTEESSFIYSLLPYFNFIQYPWRFLNFVVFSIPLLLISLNNIQNRLIKTLLIFFLASAVVLINHKYFSVQYIYPLTENDYLSSRELQFKISGISDEYLPPDLVPPKIENEIAKDLIQGEKVKLAILENETRYKSLNFFVDREVQVKTNIAFFPGWQASVDNKKIPIDKEDGFVTVNLPAGRHKLEFNFKNTPVRTVSNTISFLSLILILYLAIVPAKKWQKKSRSR